MATLEEMFPPYRLVLRCADLELRILRDEDIPEVLALKADGIVEPDLPMPFLAPWHMGPDSASLAWYWGRRAAWSPESWTAMFVVRRDGVVVGMQDVFNKTDARRTRTLVTGSWLARRYHRQGIGTRMRQLIAAFAFDALEMTELTSGAIAGNTASLGVSAKVGYVPNGTQRIARGDGYVVEHRLVLTPERFNRPTEPVTWAGVEEFKAFVEL